MLRLWNALLSLDRIADSNILVTRTVHGIPELLGIKETPNFIKLTYTDS